LESGPAELQVPSSGTELGLNIIIRIRIRMIIRISMIMTIIK
jgi:hypothetical protein